MFAETFTNPLVRAQDLACRATRRGSARPRAGPAPRHRLDDRDAVGLPHAAARARRRRRAGQRHQGARRPGRGLGGYIATNDAHLANSVMDLIAMRGGILDWRRAQAILGTCDEAERPMRGDRPRRRGSRRSSPRTRASSDVHHPSLPVTSRRRRHRARLRQRTARCSRSASPAPTKRAHGTSPTCSPRPSWCATRCRSTASPPRSTTTRRCRSTSRRECAIGAANGFDRLIRLGVGLEDADDLIAASTGPCTTGTGSPLTISTPGSARASQAWVCVTAADRGHGIGRKPQARGSRPKTQDPDSRLRRPP